MVHKIANLGNTINQELNPGVHAKSSSLEILQNAAIQNTQNIELPTEGFQIYH